MASDAKPPNRKLNRRTSYSDSHEDTPEPFPSYIEPTYFDAVTMDAQGPLGLENVRSLSVKDRQALLEGELKLELYIGGTWICSMPWRLFQTLSTKASEISDSDPKVRQMHLPAGLSKMPFLYILLWLKEITTSSPFHLLKRRNDVSEDISVCRAARLLGMTEYTQHVFNHYWALFKNTMPSLEDVAAVEQLAVTEEKLGLAGYDGAVFLDCIIKRLAYTVVNKEVSNSAALASFLQEHPKIVEGIAVLVNAAAAEGSQEGNRQKTSNSSPLTRPTTVSPNHTAPVQAGDVERLRGHFGQAAPWDHLTQPLSAVGGFGQSHKFPSLNATGTGSRPLAYGSAVKTAPVSLPISGYRTAPYSEHNQLADRVPEAEYMPYLPYGNGRNLPAYFSTDAVSKDANKERSIINNSLNPLGKNADANPFPPSFDRRNTLLGQFRPRSSTNDDVMDAQTPPPTMNFGSFNAGFGSVGQSSASHIDIKPYQVTTTPLLEMAKKMFPQPTDKSDAYRQAAQHATALLEQNAHFREERFRAAVETHFKFSNDTWRMGHAPVFQGRTEQEGPFGYQTQHNLGDETNP